MSGNVNERGSFWKRLTRGVRRLRSQPDWEAFTGEDWPDRIMSEDVRDKFFAKQGRTIARWTLNSADGRTLVVYLKRHYKLGRWAGILATLLPWKARSPGLQEWEHLEWAAEQGLPVPRAVAAGELVGPWGRLQSFIAIEELSGMLALHEAIPLALKQLDPASFRQWKRSLTQELARLARAFHGRAAFHKDLYLCHFYIRADECACVPDDWQGRVFVIDLHRLSHHRLTGLWWRAKDLAQLLYSSDEVPGITARDRLGFWKAYGAGRGLVAKLMTWIIRFKWRRYQRHNRK